MTVRDIVNALPTVAAVINALAVTVGIFYLARQTNAANKQTSAANKTFEQASLALSQTAIFSSRTHLTDINRILIENENLRKHFNLEAHEVLAYMILNDFETLWTYQAQGLIPEKFWNSKVNLIRYTLKYEWIKALWERDALRTPGHPYQPEFVKFIDGLLAEEKPRASSVSA